ncbi:MAG: Gfo/Idh/MocA family oxidoreductase, partial [Planctomycetes bacterium]|nr:Gfo/Idh/MocA family oxidoreductase [Planctomycetota bacterium]
LVAPDRVRGYRANESIGVALVGVGGRGQWFVDTIPRMQRVVAICDVDRRKVDAAFKHWQDAGAKMAGSPHEWERRAAAEFGKLVHDRPVPFEDFRQMLEKMASQIDGVVVATPDHTHAVVSAAAIRAGKPVFCEKPLTRTLHESRALRELARDNGVVTAMGNQGTYGGPFRRALELIRNGALGDITEVHVWNSGGGADQQQVPEGTEPKPPELNWDLWLGPAADRPYHRRWQQRNLWREFGTCQLGNWGSHSANLGFMALNAHHLWLRPGEGQRPTVRVEAKHSGINRLSFPRWEHVLWHLPSRGALAPITINWYNGDAPPVKDVLRRAAGDAREKEENAWRFAGTLIVGTKGSIHTTGHNMWFRLLPAEEFSGVQCERPEEVASSRGPEQDWFAAIQGGPAPWSNFDYASALNEFLMLGNVATQFDASIDFDPIAMKITNNPAADALLTSEYREGWEL